MQVSNADTSDPGHLWAAVFQGGPRACLDGASALIAGGLERFAQERIRVVRAEDVATELLRIRRAPRRLLLHAIVNDLLDDARSMGELDVAKELRRRGPPPPERQVLRTDGRGRYYVDLYWPDYRLVVEIDGIHHAWAENVVGDALRQNALALDGDTVLRLPLLGFRLQPDDFCEQIEQALVSAGWRRAA